MQESIDKGCDLFVLSPLDRAELAVKVATLIQGQVLVRQITHPLITIWVHNNGYYPPDPDQPVSLLTQAPHYLEITPGRQASWEAYLEEIRWLCTGLRAAGFEVEVAAPFAELLTTSGPRRRGPQPLGL